MPRTAGLMNFPDFRGFTRSIILWNVGIYFALLVLGAVARMLAATVFIHAALIPAAVLHGSIWQLVTYSFLHQGILNTALEMLSIWFLASFLEGVHGSRWVAELYFISVIGAGLAAVGLSFAAPAGFMLTGALGGIFGLLIAFGVLYGDMEFMLFPLPMTMKAKYLVAVYMLIAIATLFSGERIYAFAQLGGALAGFLYVKGAPRGGFAVSTSNRYFGMRNSYYKWKRRRAARKFEVYMRKQNREVRFDADGHYIDPDKDLHKDPNDRRWMN